MAAPVVERDTVASALQRARAALLALQHADGCSRARA